MNDAVTPSVRATTVSALVRPMCRPPWYSRTRRRRAAASGSGSRAVWSIRPGRAASASSSTSAWLAVSRNVTLASAPSAVHLVEQPGQQRMAADRLARAGQQLHVLDHHDRGLQRPGDRAGLPDGRSDPPDSTIAVTPGSWLSR